MKYLFNKEKRYVIATEFIDDSRLVLCDIFKGIYIYEIKIKDANNFLMESEFGIRYLDIFTIILPQEYALKEILWRTFYEYFGEVYDLLIDKQNNLLCIQEMIKYIEGIVYKNTPLVLLDYGCGNGISSSIKGKHTLYGYEPIEAMRNQVMKNKMKVFDKKEIRDIPNEYFDGVFSSYVFHLSLCENDILDIVPKMKKSAPWIANYYKGINEEYMNEMFLKNGFTINKLLLGVERFGNVYEYRKQ